MSSLARTFSQTPNPSKFFVVLFENQGWAPTQKEFDRMIEANYPGISVVGSTIIAESMDALDTAYFDDFYFGSLSAYYFNAGDLLKDMGKSIYFVVKGEIVLEYRLVQRVLSPTAENEGVPGNYNNADGGNNKYTNYGQFYVPVFSSQSYNDYHFDYVWVARSG